MSTGIKTKSFSLQVQARLIFFVRLLIQKITLSKWKNPLILHLNPCIRKSISCLEYEFIRLSKWTASIGFALLLIRRFVHSVSVVRLRSTLKDFIQRTALFIRLSWQAMVNKDLMYPHILKLYVCCWYDHAFWLDWRNWAQEPDNVNNNENCAILKIDGAFSDQDCNKQFNYICFKESKTG